MFIGKKLYVEAIKLDNIALAYNLGYILAQRQCMCSCRLASGTSQRRSSWIGTSRFQQPKLWDFEMLWPWKGKQATAEQTDLQYVIMVVYSSRHYYRVSDILRHCPSSSYYTQLFHTVPEVLKTSMGGRLKHWNLFLALPSRTKVMCYMAFGDNTHGIAFYDVISCIGGERKCVESVWLRKLHTAWLHVQEMEFPHVHGSQMIGNDY